MSEERSCHQKLKHALAIQSCPLFWRRYSYLSTSERDAELARRESLVAAGGWQQQAFGAVYKLGGGAWCYECARQGHYGDVRVILCWCRCRMFRSSCCLLTGLPATITTSQRRRRHTIRLLRLDRLVIAVCFCIPTWMGASEHLSLQRRRRRAAICRVAARISRRRKGETKGDGATAGCGGGGWDAGRRRRRRRGRLVRSSASAKGNAGQTAATASGPGSSARHPGRHTQSRWCCGRFQAIFADSAPASIVSTSRKRQQ